MKRFAIILAIGGVVFSGCATTLKKDGTTFESAVPVTATDFSEVSSEERAWIESNLPGAEIIEITNAETIPAFVWSLENGGFVWPMKIRMPDGQERLVYFDITEAYKIRDPLHPSEFRAALSMPNQAVDPTRAARARESP